VGINEGKPVSIMLAIYTGGDVAGFEESGCCCTKLTTKMPIARNSCLASSACSACETQTHQCDLRLAHLLCLNRRRRHLGIPQLGIPRALSIPPSPSLSWEPGVHQEHHVTAEATGPCHKSPPLPSATSQPPPSLLLAASRPTSPHREDIGHSALWSSSSPARRPPFRPLLHPLAAPPALPLC